MSLDSRSAHVQITGPSSPQPSVTEDVIIEINNDVPTKIGVENLHDHAESKTKRKNRLVEERKAIHAQIRETIDMPITDFPIGYPLQAAFQCSGPGCSLYRAFGCLHSRVILELQDELRCYEEELAYIDAADAYSSNLRQQRRVRSRDADLEEARKEAIHNNQPSDEPSPRATLLAEIRTKLVEYDEILMNSRALAEFARPNSRDYYNIRRWFWNWKPLSYEREEEFIRRKEDLITLWPRAEFGKFDVLIGDCVHKMPS